MSLQDEWDSAAPSSGTDLSAEWDAAAPPDSSFFGDMVGGAVSGAANIGSNIVAPVKAAFAGTGQTGARAERENINKTIANQLREWGFNPESYGFKTGQIATEIAGTAGVGPARVVAAGIPGKFSVGLAHAAPAASLTGRMAQGAVSAGAGTAMVAPEHTSVGAGFGAAIPVAGSAISGATRLAGGLYDFIRGNLAQVRAGKMMRDIAGPEQAAIQQALESAPAGLTAAQAAAAVPRDEFAALGALATKHDPTAYRLIGERQQGVRSSAMNRLARGATTEETNRTISAMAKDLEARLGPVRINELASANVGGKVIDPMLRQADELDYQAMLFGGTSAEADRLRQTAGAFGALGYKPIDLAPIATKIGNVLDDPSLGASERVSSVMQDVAQGLNTWAKKGGGIIDAEALYMKRKEAINEAVMKLTAGADPSVTQKLTAKLTNQLRPLIDDALEAAGATGWKTLMGKYAKGFEEMERVELLGVLRNLQTESPKKFMKVISGMKPEVVQKIMQGKDGVLDALPASTLTTLRTIAGELQRDAQLKARASAATQSLSNIVGKDAFGFRLPGFLNRFTTVTNATLDAIEANMNQKTLALVTDAMKSGKSANDLMKMLPAHERDAAMRWIASGGPERYAQKATPAVINQEQ